MKRFTKIASILSGIIAMIGIGCLVMAFVIGLTPIRFMAMFEDGEFRFQTGNHKPVYIKDHEMEYDEIEEGVSNIELEFLAGNLEICYGDVRDIQIEHQNAAEFGWTCDEDTLRIWKDTVFEDNSDVFLKIILPKNTTYEKIYLEIGASQAKIRDIIAEEIDISVGTGKADIRDLQAEVLSLEVGAGELNVWNLDAKDLDIEAGIGQVNVEVDGVESAYDYKVECGIGEVKIGETSYSGWGTEHHSSHHEKKHHGEDSDCKIDIKCGIGQVNVKFTGNFGE